MIDPRLADPRSGGAEAPTTSLAEAAKVAWHVVVIGAGPAGSALAARLAARGLRVLLVDAAAMPRAKICGCCLSTRAVQELAHLAQRVPGNDPTRRHAAGLPPGSLPLERVRLATAAVTAVVPLSGGSVVSREGLDSAGVERATAAGAAWLPQTRAITVADQAGGAVVELATSGPERDGPSSRSLATEIVVVAAGLADAIRGGEGSGHESGRIIAAHSRVGLGTTLPPAAGGPPPGELVMAVSRRGYCGIVRLEDGRIDVAAAVDRGTVTRAGSPAAAIAALLGETGGDHAANLASLDAARLLAAATFRGAPPLTRRRSVASASGRMLRIGDAAGYVEPFTGEGMGWALTSARLCDEALAALVTPDGRLTGDVAAAGIRYAQAHRRHFAVHHARCRRVSLVVRRPWLVGSALRLARLAPAVAARFVPLVVGAADPQEAHG